MPNIKKGNSLTRDDFNAKLKKANLSKKEFASILKTSYNTVNAWGSNGREVPYWVSTWLNLYKCCDDSLKLKELLRDNICKKIKI